VIMQFHGVFYVICLTSLTINLNCNIYDKTSRESVNPPYREDKIIEDLFSLYGSLNTIGYERKPERYDFAN
jgi:hypothetical protein